MHNSHDVPESVMEQCADVFEKDSYSFFNGLGNKCLDKGDFKQAEEYFRSSLAIKENTEALRGLSAIHPDIVEHCLNRCCAIEPSKENFIALLSYLIEHKELSYAALIYESLKSELKTDPDIRKLLYG